MIEIKIDKGIKIPAPKAKYPFSKMAVGDSFLSSKKAALSAYQYGGRNGKKFEYRKEGDDIRIWRVK